MRIKWKQVKVGTLVEHRDYGLILVTKKLVRSVKPNDYNAFSQDYQPFDFEGFALINSYVMYNNRIKFSGRFITKIYENW